MNRLILTLLLYPMVSAFRVVGPTIRRTSHLLGTSLPTIEQLSSDPFMKQVQYGFDLTNEIAANPEGANLKESVQAQLSHSDGIRGFMVSYLTAEDSPADLEIIPQVILEALEYQAENNSHDLIPLACMNVVMPTAMMTMHQDPEQAANSAMTAKRGVRVLRALRNYQEVKQNAKAILAVANGETTDSDLVKYWIDFFEKWGYEEPQRKDIAKAMGELLD